MQLSESEFLYHLWKKINSFQGLWSYMHYYTISYYTYALMGFTPSLRV